MTDPADQRPIVVSTESPSGPYIWLSVEAVEKVRRVLVDNEIPHWVDHHAVSVDGLPARTMLYVGKKVDARRVQELLDAAA